MASERGARERIGGGQRASLHASGKDDDGGAVKYRDGRASPGCDESVSIHV